MNLNLTTVLAIWGAFLSTLLAIIEVAKFRKDKSIVKVSVRGGYTVVPQDHPLNPYGDKSLILISAVNKGRRPVYLTHAGLLGKRGMGHLTLVDSVKSVELKEGQSNQYQMLEDEVKESGLIPEEYVAFVIDSTGKMYYSHNFLKRLYRLHRIK